VWVIFVDSPKKKCKNQPHHKAWELAKNFDHGVSSKQVLIVRLVVEASNRAQMQRIQSFKLMQRQILSILWG